MKERHPSKGSSYPVSGAECGYSAHEIDILSMHMKAAEGSTVDSDAPSTPDLDELAMREIAKGLLKDL